MALADAAVRAAVRFDRAPLGADPSVAEVVAAIAGEERPFLLHGRWGLPAGASPDARVVVAGAAPVWQLGAGSDPMLAFDEVPPLIGGHELPAGVIGGGLVGWLGFDLGRGVETTLGPQPPRPTELPAARLAWYPNVLRRDERGTWWVEALLPATRADASIDTALARWRDRLARATPLPAGRLGRMRPRTGATAHLAAIEETIERIRAGELFQANVCLRLEGELVGTAAALAEPVLTATDPWYGGWIDGGRGRAIVSASPELFLRRTGRDVVTHPIKGTAPRMAGVVDPAADPAAASLVASAKDQAEHVMIVDLMRNDLGRVCDYGSVHWDATPKLEPHAGVWHLVSEVGGRLHEDMGDGRLLRATFPPGSVTGAPKVQAMRVIAAVEGTGREVYTGALGLCSPASGMELAVAIRTLEVCGDRAWVGVGGGIVADSRPSAELREALTKASALVGAAGGTVDPAPASVVEDGRGRVPNAPWLASAADRPDPRAGLLETLFVSDGAARHVGRHAARLDGSLRALGHPPLHPSTAQRIRALAATAAGPSRLRVLAVPDPDGHASHLTEPQLQLVAQTVEALDPVVLVPYVVPGGLGAHKWLDRRLVDRASAALGGTPVLVDADGTVLEAGWGNLWWLADDRTLRTPPLDGRILPGVMRAVLLERAAELGLSAGEASIELDGQLAHRPLFITSARGVTPARVAGTPPGVVAQGVALAERLAPLTADRS